MEPTEQLAEILPMLTKIVGRIEPAQLDQPTPCATFTVRDVVEHMIGGAATFAPLFRGESVAAGAEARSDVAGTTDAPTGTNPHPAQRFRAAMAELLDAVRSPGALSRTIEAPIGTVSGDVFARFVAFDGLVHGWDLATSIGQPYEPPEELLANVDAFARSALVPAMRDGDTFGDEADAPVGAGTMLRLAAFTGRRV